jgi:hypothetical protein
LSDQRCRSGQHDGVSEAAAAVCMATQAHPPLPTQICLATRAVGWLPRQTTTETASASGLLDHLLEFSSFGDPGLFVQALRPSP